MEVVVEAVLDHRADRDLRLRPERLHGLGEHVRAVVPDQLQAARVGAVQELDAGIAVDRVVEVGDRAVERHGDGALGQRLGDALDHGAAGGAGGDLPRVAVGEGEDRHGARVSGLSPAYGAGKRFRGSGRVDRFLGRGNNGAVQLHASLAPARRSDARDRPRAPGRRGHGPGDRTRDAGRRGNPGVGQARAGSDPRGAPRHRPGMVPGRCRLSRRGVSDVPVLRLPVSGLGRGARTPCPQPPEPASAPWPSSRPPPRRGRVRRSLRVSPEAGRRGGISSPAGQSAARSHARVRGTPRTGPPPGAMAAESHRRGRRPVPGPDRSATGQAPEGRPGIAPKTPRTGAVRKHRIGTLSRLGGQRRPVSVSGRGGTARLARPGTPAVRAVARRSGAARGPPWDPG